MYLYSIQLSGHLHTPRITMTVISKLCAALKDGSGTGPWKGVCKRSRDRLCSCEDQWNNSVEKLLCLLVTKPAKQLAATWSVDTLKERNAIGRGSCVIPRSPSGLILWENRPIPMSLQTKLKLLFNVRMFLRLEEWEKQFPRVSSYPMAILNICTMINFEKWSNFPSVNLYAGQTSLTEQLDREC